jgi:hypothetical protein
VSRPDESYQLAKVGEHQLRIGHEEPVQPDACEKTSRRRGVLPSGDAPSHHGRVQGTDKSNGSLVQIPFVYPDYLDPNALVPMIEVHWVRARPPISFVAAA